MPTLLKSERAYGAEPEDLWASAGGGGRQPAARLLKKRNTNGLVSVDEVGGVGADDGGELSTMKSTHRERSRSAASAACSTYATLSTHSPRAIASAQSRFNGSML